METLTKLEEDTSKSVDEEVGGEIKRELEFTTFFRWHHWLRVISIIALITTGFYIANPFIIPVVNAEPTNFLNAEFRGWHEIFGFLMIAMFMAKTYYFLFSVKDKMEITSVKDIFSIKNWVGQIGYYLFLTKHPKLSGAYNVVQFVAYVFFYIMISGLIITGLIMYAHSYHEGIGGLIYEVARSAEVLLGGLANVRMMHHIMMWGVILFTVGHVYMVVFNSVYGKEGTIDSMFSGHRFKRKSK